MASQSRHLNQSRKPAILGRSLPPSLRFTRNVWLLLVLTLAVFTSIGVVAVTMNLYLVARGYREDFIGLVSFASAVALTAAAIPAGSLSNRFGAKRCLIGGTAGLAIAGALAATVASPWAILAAMVLHGLSQAFIFVPSAPYLMENSRSDDHSRAFAASFAAISLGGIIGSTLGGFVPLAQLAGAETTVDHYRVTLLVGATLAALGACAMIGARDRPSEQPEPSEPESTPSAVDSDDDLAPQTRKRRHRIVREIAAMGIATALLNVPTALMTVFFNVYLHEQVGASTQAIGLVYAIGAAVMVPLGLAGPGLGARFGAARVIAAARLIAGLVVLVPAGRTSFGAGAASFVLRSGLVGLAQPIDSAFVMGRMPRRWRAHVSAVRNMSLDISWALTSIVAGYVVVQWGYRPIFVIGAVCTVASAAVYYAVFGNATTAGRGVAAASAVDGNEPGAEAVKDLQR